jgi:soluble lytic murein transglycosylase-like protein
MKFIELPKKVVLEPSTSSIKTPENKTFKVFKYSILTVITIALLTAVMYLNVVREQTLFLQNKPIASSVETDVLIFSKTAAIIARDGNLPLAVAKKYAVWVYDAAAEHAVDPILLIAVMAIESKFNYKAVSPTGPIGLFQVAASWHKDKTTRAQLFDPRHNIFVGAQILKEYANLSNSTLETLLRYNGSLGQAPNYAIKVLNKKKKYDNEIMKAVVS